ncbi:sporulation inhibitor of replication protein SirA [Alkalihalobacillus sp. LMS39]|uniref:sporulation inhibitor of replication protein SirA n=1 Tax=Alkalihalobacillus sp. LMS39 TaxID=2924032 RepID=UPI001FB2215E|nr:sporulation inhibitor of replication protein SirA [Alkalihalobacillus sp. LMS39]UOE92751.1 sporulation inhibitor of replication protein SirA [Alkalihalobacillus sp. LMS39]
MRHYDIYLMEKEVARHYFGQESKLFHLFLEQKKATTEFKAIYEKQIEFITRPISTLQLQQLVGQAFKRNQNYEQFKNTHYLSISQPFSQAELTLNPTMITVTSDGGYEAETIFFEVLRKYNACFFAMDMNDFRFGWLNPIKQVKLI